MQDQKPDPLASILETKRKVDAAAKEAKRLSGRAIDPSAVIFTTQRKLMAHLTFDASLAQKWVVDPGFPGGRDGPWDASAVFAWWRENRDRHAEVDMDGPPSPALERYREARAKMVELDYDERRGELIPRDDWNTFVGRVCGILRRAAEVLQRTCGPSAHAVLDDAIISIEREGVLDDSAKDKG